MSGTTTLIADAQEIADALGIKKIEEKEYYSNKHAVAWFMSEALVTMARRIVELEKEVKELKQSKQH